MENQVNVGDQNTQQIGQNSINQPPPIPEKPRVNYWMISTVLFAFLFLGTLGWRVISPLQNNSGQKNIFPSIQQPTSIPSTPTATSNNSEETEIRNLIATFEKHIEERNVNALMSLFTPAATKEEIDAYKNLMGLEPPVGSPRLFGNVSSNFIVTSWKISKRVYPDNKEIISKESDSKYVVLVEETRKSWCNVDPCAGTYSFENSGFYVFEIIKKDSQRLVDKYYPQKASPQSPPSTKYEAFGF